MRRISLFTNLSARRGRALPWVVALALSGCTFNADWLDAPIVAEGDPGSFSTLSIDATEAGSPLEGTALRIVGSEVDPATAAAHVVGLVGVRDDVAAITSNVTVEWVRLDASTVGVDVIAATRLPDHVWLDELRADVPPSSDLVLQTTTGSIEVSGILGRVEAHATDGSIVVSDAGIVDLSAGDGSIHVSAEAGNVHTESGSIELDLAGWVDASANDGSIAGRIGGGGTMSAGDGSIAVDLTQPLDRDLEITTGDGSIVLTVPRGASMTFDVQAQRGSVRIDVGDVAFGGHEFVGDARDGGFTVRVRAGDGSVRISER